MPQRLRLQEIFYMKMFEFDFKNKSKLFSVAIRDAADQPNQLLYIYYVLKLYLITQ